MTKPKPDVQTAVMIVSLIWGMYWLTSWRTQDFGFSFGGTLGLILLAVISVLPVTVLAVLGLPRRKAIIRLALALLVMVGFAETFAGIQELLVVQRYGDDPGKQIFIARWPPFKNHHIGYSPGYGWIGGD
jgi:hypothetical protein